MDPEELARQEEQRRLALAAQQQQQPVPQQPAPQAQGITARDVLGAIPYAGAVADVATQLPGIISAADTRLPAGARDIAAMIPYGTVFTDVLGYKPPEAEAPPPQGTPLPSPVERMAVPEAPPQRPPEQDLEAYARALSREVPSVGAPQVRMDKRVEAGVLQQQEALRKLGLQYGTLGDRMSRGEAEYIKQMDLYRKGLGEIDARRRGLEAGRQAERGLEEQELAGARMRFDANRIYSDMASQPLGTAGLAIAAGIVQGLQGYAGQDKPNAIIGAIQEAAQRDIANQVEQYRRMQAGQQYSKTAFTEARQAIGDEQQALQVAAMATLDQIGKGLEFVKRRMGTAKDIAEYDAAQGKLQVEIGKAATDLAMKNAENVIQTSIANQSAQKALADRLLQARIRESEKSEAARQHAREKVAQFTMTDRGMTMRDAVENAQEFYDVIGRAAVTDPKSVGNIVSRDMLDTLIASLKGAHKVGDTGEVLATTFSNALGETIAGKKWSEEKRRAAQIIGRAYATYLREELGKNQTASEVVNARAAADLSNPQAVFGFVRRLVDKTQGLYNQQVAIDPNSADTWYQAYGHRIAAAAAANNAINDAFKNAQILAEGR